MEEHEVEKIARRVMWDEVKRVVGPYDFVTKSGDVDVPNLIAPAVETRDKKGQSRSVKLAIWISLCGSIITLVFGVLKPMIEKWIGQ